jgi:hypothetical protein
MITEEYVYKKYRQEQSRVYGRPYRLPQNWDKFFAKMDPQKKVSLTRLTLNFNTKWTNVNPDLYIETGFEVFGPRFHYHWFLDKRILNLYISKDRAIKRETENIGESLCKSINFVDSILPDGPTSKLYRYANMYDGNRPRALTDYLANNIDKYFLVWLIKEDYVTIRNEQAMQLCYINEQYSKYLRILRSYLQTVQIKEVFGKIL